MAKFGKLTFLFFFSSALITGCSILREPTSYKSGPAAGREELLRKDVVQYAKRHLGADYRYAGRDPRGFDCSGFTHYIMKNFDVGLPVSSRDQARQGRSIPPRDARPGDLVFFRRSPISEIFHVALVVANDRQGMQVIHSTSRGVVIDNVSESDYWRPKVSSARRVL
jgi:cell wall-associated NlpC family hydrolase